MIPKSHIQKYIYLRSIASTNAFLSDYTAKNNPSHNICVYTFEQTGGKGQIGRKWFSDTDKNLSLSYFLPNTDQEVSEHFSLNKCISLSLLDFLKQLMPEQNIQIKWPNDLYVDDRKIAGLLVQNQIKQKKISQSIIGIGININQEHFPEDLPNPVSIFQILGTKKNLSQLVYKLSAQFLLKLESYRNNPKLRDARYYQHMLAYKQKAQFRDNNDVVFEGEICGVEDNGKLCILSNEEIRSFNHGEITLLSF